MKTKRFLWAVFVVALVIAVFLIAMSQYYVVVALVIGALIMRHREIWSLVKTGKLPPVDERVRENTGKAIRNGFIFFAVATAMMMLPFGGVVTRDLDTVRILSALFLAAGLVYLLTYLFYDRAQPKMTPGRLKMLKTYLLIIGISVGVFIIGVFLHNAIYALFNVEEPVFFIIAVIVSPLALVVGLIGSLVVFIMGLAGRTS
jgi:hypothetical protein